MASGDQETRGHLSLTISPLFEGFVLYRGATLHAEQS